MKEVLLKRKNGGKEALNVPKRAYASDGAREKNSTYKRVTSTIHQRVVTSAMNKEVSLADVLKGRTGIGSITSGCRGLDSEEPSELSSMESLSRPLHRNQASSATFSKKLSNVNSFSAKNAYDGVFDGASKFGAATSSTRIEDYSEIFGGSQASRASSIPILDLSALDEARVSADARTSNLDYSKIFGGLRGEDIAISYEEMFATPKGAKSFSDEARTPAKAASPSDGSDQLNRSREENFQYAAPNQSSEGMKQFNMSYHKTIQRSDDETNGTTHVAQLRAVPAFTCFIDENHPHRKTEGDKSVPPTKVDVKSPPKVDVNLTKKQTSDDIGKFKTQSSWDKFNSINKSFMTASRAGPGDCSPSYSDEEVDVNSAAAASAAALRIALEKAQASIRIAKELMDRKKDGPQRFSKPSSKDGLDVKKRKEDKATIEENRTREKNGKEIFQSADVVLQVFTKSEREKARRSGKVAPDFKESEEIFIVKEVGGETKGNKLESAEDCEALRSGKVAPEFKENTHKCGRKEMETRKKSWKQLDGYGKKVDEEAPKLEDFEGKLNAVKMARDLKQPIYKLDTAQEVHEQEENEKARVAQGDEETEEKQKASSGQETYEKKLEESLEESENEEFFESEEGKANSDEEGLDDAQESLENEEETRRDNEEGCEVESNEKGQNDAHKEEDNEKSLDINYNRVSDGPSGDESEEKQEDDSDWVAKEKILVEACEYEETENMKRETEGNAATELNPEAVLETMNLDATRDACKQDADESVNVTQSSCDYKEDENGFGAVEVAHELGEKEICKLGDLVEDAAEHIEIDTEMKYATEALLFDDNSENIGSTAPNSGPKQTYQNEKEAELDSNLGSGINISECESGTGEKKFEEDKIASDLEEVESFDSADEERQWVEMEEKIEASEPHIEEKEAKETAQEEVKAEKENLSKNDEANKREREREKDKRVVERAIREARERAFAEARERAERAAVERATAEARQRVMADARERFEKSSAAAKSSAEKASIKAKLRAERAAVERATAEARERALEKALSQKATTSGVREQVERYVSEKFSSDSRDNGMRQSFPSSDTQKFDGSIGESAQRSKARLERHQRTMERAAKALAEKNKRDLLAQKEQAEKNRLAETLDAEVKRWSSGKEGNLRALLSTLQYILGPDSGWQPISLTEIVTTSAVKKAYRKATLHVHPDKLQQRGASIQQKYICEKVFDLLKAAWNRFNFEER
ncbi:hypothetical protein HYC85_008641 [Camellia sinensis]|uniref:J domain-containing protein n=1 Tax=Camellia sinensis TaxID=4442 RepID=A0A7J7HTD6_CAMSI|nr:hypothetical protein HYC85_008641 [Camellia sinensis]